jgi:hypothetical protein
VRLDTLHSVEDAYGSVKDRHAAVNFETEVPVAWRVDEVYDLGLNARRALVLGRPSETDSGGLDGDLPLCFQFEEIGCGVAVIDI